MKRTGCFLWIWYRDSLWDFQIDIMVFSTVRNTYISEKQKWISGITWVNVITTTTSLAIEKLVMSYDLDSLIL